jgi:polysaccharide biosynthesis/export protein
MVKNMGLFFSRVVLLGALAALAGCASYIDLAPGTVVPISSPVVEKETVTVTPEKPEPPPAADYLIGPGDVLLININGKPEYSVIGTSSGSKVQGSRVDGNGDIHVPLMGTLRVAGLTVSQVQERLQGPLRKYLQEPWVVVEIAEYKSQPIYLLGQFKNSGVFYLDRPLTLLQGIALGNGFDTSANLRSACLIRDKKIAAVDVYDLLRKGDAAQNVWLRQGDTIYIPDNRNQQVFIFGAVKKPGAVPLPTGGLNLAQAIASAELKDVGYDFRHVRIIRSLSTTRGELIVVDFDKVLRGEALPFQLQEGDIVYVPQSPFGTWNEAIAELLPSLQAVSAILQPFVQIEFLRR